MNSARRAVCVTLLVRRGTKRGTAGRITGAEAVMAGAGGTMSSAQGGVDEGCPSEVGQQVDLPPLLAAAFAGGGEMGELMGRLDWSAHPLGTPDRWPPALCSAIGLMLASSAQI